MNKPKQTKPLVSVILPVFKSEKYLESCLKSLSAQSYKNIEIVAVVDYLGDNCLKILRNYKKIEPRLRVYANVQRYGLASTLNKAVEKANGQFIAFMDPIGASHRTRVSKQVRFLRKNPKVAAVGAQTSQTSQTGSSFYPLLHEEIYKNLISGSSMKFETVTLDKTRLPKDILKFKKGTPYPFLYVDVFMKIGLYKELANLGDALLRAREISRPKKQTLNLEKKFSFIKILFEGTTLYEYKPSLKSIFYPLIKQI